MTTKLKNNGNATGNGRRLPSLTCRANINASNSAVNNKNSNFSNKNYCDSNNSNIENRQGYFAASSTDNGKERCDAATETMYCEIDVQTNPFSPDYYIPDSCDKNATGTQATSQ